MSALMSYLLLVSSVVAAAALLTERALAAFDRPTRIVWLPSLLVSAALPIASFTLNDPEAAAVAPEQPAASTEQYALGADPDEPSAVSASGADWQQWAAWAEWSEWRRLIEGTIPMAAALDDALLLLWIAGSALVLLAYGAAWAVLCRNLRLLPRARIGDTEVLVSGCLGPAVFGLRRPSVIVPGWLLSASARMQATVVRHERAHVAAGDTWWLAAGTLIVALVPWNPLMWWQLKRLRAAVEIDCDARVVRDGIDPTGYAHVLVAVARRRAALRRAMPAMATLGAAATTGSQSQLRRRVQRLIHGPSTGRCIGGLCAAGAAAALVAACAVEPPERVPAEPSATAADARGEIAREPLTGLAVGGERVVVLVDVSASMLDHTSAGVERRLAGSAEERRSAPKWQHLVAVVESLGARISVGARFQVILFAEDARAALPGTSGQWLTATPDAIRQTVDVLRDRTVPAGRSNLRAALEAARALQPPPDVVHLVVDGLPSADGAAGAGPASEEERMALFQAAAEAVPHDAALNVILLPREGEGIAASAYWTLTHRTGGALFAPVEGEIPSRLAGFPLDSEYLIFIVDTSGSMRQYGMPTVQRHIRETLEAYPIVRGIQVMNDAGEYLFEMYRDEWIPDSPSARRSILEAVENWDAFSASSPRAGLVQAIETFHDPDKRIALFVFGDDLARTSAEETLAAVDRVNRDAETGATKMRIHAVAIPVYLDVTGELMSSALYAFAMRELTLRHGGVFIAPASR